MSQTITLCIPYYECHFVVNGRVCSLTETATLSPCQLNNHPFCVVVGTCEEHLAATITIQSIDSSPHPIVLTTCN